MAGGSEPGEHIAGARRMDYMAIGVTRNDLSLELPTVDSIQHLVEGAGISDDSHVILVGSPPLVATRVFFTLDYFGLKHVSILNGGLPAWKSAGGPVATAYTTPARGHATPHPRPEILASAADVQQRIGKRGTSFIDTRAEGEYLGSDVHRGIPSTGHVEGARLLEWQNLFTDANEFTPKDLPTLQRMWKGLVAPGDTAITYCYIGYRASGSYFMSRYLGYVARLFDGSYEEWNKKNLPTVKAVTPPLPAAREERP
jgi:thiosulfate/3-mercaptopyruvate sulfurtransferase